MRDESSPYFSRPAVIEAQERAWALDGKFRLVVYDGTRFWRRREHSTRYAIIPRGKAPAFGWMHKAGCSCDLCVPESRETSRAA